VLAGDRMEKETQAGCTAVNDGRSGLNKVQFPGVLAALQNKVQAAYSYIAAFYHLPASST
jgi:hypothetical protein